MIELDRQITLWINSLGCESWDGFWLFMSNAKVWFPLYAAIMALIIWKLGWKKGLIVIASLILTVVATDQLSGLVKSFAHRLRPCYDPWMLEHGVHAVAHPHSQFGFFSSHAANTFGFAIASSIGLSNCLFKRDNCHSKGDNCHFEGDICHFERSRKIYFTTVYTSLIFLWATLVSLSRVMLAAHFFGDILVGAVFGLVVGCGIAMIVKSVIAK